MARPINMVCNRCVFPVKSDEVRDGICDVCHNLPEEPHTGEYVMMLDLVPGTNAQGDAYLAAVMVEVGDATASYRLTPRRLANTDPNELLALGRLRALRAGYNVS